MMALRAVLRQGAQAARWAATAPATIAPARSLRTMTFGNEKETVVERSDYPVDKIQKVCANKRPEQTQQLHCQTHPPPVSPHVAPCALLCAFAKYIFRSVYVSCA